MDFIQDYDLLTSQEKEKFIRVMRRLLKQTFIVRDKNDESRNLYFFVKKNSDLFNDYVKYMGFDVIVNQDTGVVMLANSVNDTGESRVSTNRLQLRKIESIILCCLWTMYVDRLKSGRLTKAVIVSVSDLRFELEKYNVKDKVDKTALDNALKKQGAYQLTDVVGSIGEEDCVIRIYPSIEFSLDTVALENFVRNASERMQDINTDEVEIGEV